MAVNGEARHLITCEEADKKTESEKFYALFFSLQKDLASMWNGKNEVLEAVSWFNVVG